MSRPRAGHAWTGLTSRSDLVYLIARADGHWITSGCARGWPRCSRCRRPTEQAEYDACDARCCTCYYYHSDRGGRAFWDCKADDFFPYGIGARQKPVPRSMHALKKAVDVAQR